MQITQRTENYARRCESYFKTRKAPGHKDEHLMARKITTADPEYLETIISRAVLFSITLAVVPYACLNTVKIFFLAPIIGLIATHYLFCTFYISDERRKTSIFYKVRLLAFSVILPAIAIFAESASHLCTYFYFDLVPNTIILFCALAVPVLNAFLFRDYLNGNCYSPQRTAFLHGLQIGLSLPFVLACLPLAIAAVFAVILGYPWLPIIPVVALACSFEMYHQLGKTEESLPKNPAIKKGVAVGAALFLLAASPTIITRSAVCLADHFPESDLPIALLKGMNNREELLISCYPAKRLIDLISLPVSPDIGQRVFKRVFDKPYTEYSQPSHLPYSTSTD